jgi:hypothetical protein
MLLKRNGIARAIADRANGLKNIRFESLVE